MTDNPETLVRLQDLAFVVADGQGICSVTAIENVAAETRLALARRLIESIGDEAEERGDSYVRGRCLDAIDDLEGVAAGVKATRETELGR